MPSLLVLSGWATGGVTLIVIMNLCQEGIEGVYIRGIISYD